MGNSLVPKTHYREVEFLKNIQSVGLNAEVCEKSFYLPNGTKYTPDFYIPAINTYVEVIGTRQAHELNRYKYSMFVKEFYANIMFITHDFSNLFETKHIRSLMTDCIVSGCRKSPRRIYKDKRCCPKHHRQLEVYGECEKYDGEWKKDKNEQCATNLEYSKKFRFACKKNGISVKEFIEKHGISFYVKIKSGRVNAWREFKEKEPQIYFDTVNMRIAV